MTFLVFSISYSSLLCFIKFNQFFFNFVKLWSHESLAQIDFGFILCKLSLTFFVFHLFFVGWLRFLWLNFKSIFFLFVLDNEFLCRYSSKLFLSHWKLSLVYWKQHQSSLHTQYFQMVVALTIVQYFLDDSLPIAGVFILHTLFDI